MKKIVIGVACILIVLTSILLYNMANKEENIFTSDSFEKCVREHIVTSTVDIEKHDLESITSLICNIDESEFNLNGVEYMSNLELLYISYEGHSEIDFSNISSLSNLDSMYIKASSYSNISNSNLTELKISVYSNQQLEEVIALSNLEYLALNFNSGEYNIEGISNLNNLSYLSLDKLNASNEVKINKLPVNENTTEMYIGIELNNYQDLELLKNVEDLSIKMPAGSGLDVLTDLVNLRSLTIEGNDLDYSSLSSLTGLEELRINFSNIKDINFLENMTELKHLEVSYNDIVNIKVLENLTNLVFLDLSANNITDIDALEGMISLETLILYENDIDSIDALAGLKNLVTLDIQSNNIKDIKVIEQLNSLEHFYFEDNPIEDESYADEFEEHEH